jgi:hypothetical protein
MSVFSTEPDEIAGINQQVIHRRVGRGLKNLHVEVRMA